jgi:hypothetical protein
MKKNAWEKLGLSRRRIARALNFQIREMRFYERERSLLNRLLYLELRPVRGSSRKNHRDQRRLAYEASYHGVGSNVRPLRLARLRADDAEQPGPGPLRELHAGHHRDDAGHHARERHLDLRRQGRQWRQGRDTMPNSNNAVKPSPGKPNIPDPNNKIK